MNELKAECTTRNCSALDEKSVGKSRSLFSRNEPGNTGLHNGIKPYSRLDSITDLPHGLFRNGGNIKVLEDAVGCLRSGQGSRPALDSPGEQHLSRGLLDSLSDSSDDRVFQQIGLAAMTEGSESLQHDALLSAIIQKVPFWQIRM